MPKVNRGQHLLKKSACKCPCTCGARASLAGSGCAVAECTNKPDTARKVPDTLPSGFPALRARHGGCLCHHHYQQELDARKVQAAASQTGSPAQVDAVRPYTQGNERPLEERSFCQQSFCFDGCALSHSLTHTHKALVHSSRV